MPARLSALVLLLVTCQLGGAATSAPEPRVSSEWPHARGPAFDGRIRRTTPLQPWTAEGPARRWEQPLGQGFSGLVVAAGRIYTQHQTSAGQELLCLDLAAGTVLWRSRYAYPWEMDGKYPGPYGTPTVVGDRVYFSDCYGAIACANTSDGTIRWRFDAVRQLSPEGVDFGYAATPLVMAGRVYAPAPAGGGGVALFCLDATTGALVWRAGTSYPSYASCMPVTLGRKDCLLLALRNGIALFDRETGRELWKDEWTRGYDEHSIWPIYEPPYLFCPSAFRRGARVYRIAATGGTIRVEPVWEQRVLSNDVLASALHGGHLYGFDVQSQQSELRGRTRGTLKCVELATGNIRWTQTGIRHCSVTLVGDQLLLLEDDGDLVLVDPSPDAYREVARATLPQKGKIWAAPVVVGDRLLVRGPESLACYALGGESPESTQPAAIALAIPPAPATTGGLDRVRAGIERYRTDAFIAPSIGVLAEWYAYALVLLGLAFVIPRQQPTGPWRPDWTTSAVALGLLGTAGITVALDRFSFVLPLSLYALFCRVVPLARDPRAIASVNPRRLRAYAALAAFGAICLAYYQACAWVFLVSGWGFLTGFPALVLLAAAAPRALPQAWKARPAFAPAFSLTAFTAYFWTSAIFILWHAK